MIMSNFLRFFAGCLTAWYPNKKISIKKDIELRRFILRKIKKINVKNVNLQKTHQKLFARPGNYHCHNHRKL